VTDELEAIRQLKARYCRFLDTKDVDGWRGVFTTDVVVTLDVPVQGVDNFVPMVMGSLENSATAATGIHETYEKRDGSWRIKALHLTRTILKLSGDGG
jgi:hypothetical protein